MRSNIPSCHGQHWIVQEEDKEEEEISHPTKFEQLQEIEIVGHNGQSSQCIQATAGNNPYVNSANIPDPLILPTSQRRTPPYNGGMEVQFFFSFSFLTEVQMFCSQWRYTSYVYFFASNGGTELLLTMNVQIFCFWWMYKYFTSDGGTELLLMMEVQIFHFQWRYKYFAYNGGTDLMFLTKVQIFCLLEEL